MTSYEKQLKWKKMSQLKTDKAKQIQTLKKDHEQTFTPVLNGTSSTTTIGSNGTQIKLQQDHSNQKEGKLSASNQLKMHSNKLNNTTKNSGQIISNSTNVLNIFSGNQISKPPSEVVPNSDEQSEQRDELEDFLSAGSSKDFEPIIECLERERKEWQVEREKLIQCIHLQQLELTQRSIAAHDRAIDIAKEFAKAIESFEERLLSVEMNVQKEILQMKSVADSLLSAATTLNNAALNNSNNHHNKTN